MLETLYGIAELPTYMRLAEKLLSVEERQDLINYLAIIGDNRGQTTFVL